jgi:hypothetical protein
VQHSNATLQEVSVRLRSVSPAKRKKGPARSDHHPNGLRSIFLQTLIIGPRACAQRALFNARIVWTKLALDQRTLNERTCIGGAPTSTPARLRKLNSILSEFEGEEVASSQDPVVTPDPQAESQHREHMLTISQQQRAVLASKSHLHLRVRLRWLEQLLDESEGVAQNFDEMAYTERILAEESHVLERRPRRNFDARFDLLDKRLASYSMWLVHLANLLAQVERSSSAHDVAVVANLVQQLRETTRGETAGDLAVPNASALKHHFI